MFSQGLYRCFHNIQGKNEGFESARLPPPKMSILGLPPQVKKDPEMPNQQHQSLLSVGLGCLWCFASVIFIYRVKHIVYHYDTYHYR